MHDDDPQLVTPYRLTNIEHGTWNRKL